MKELILYDFKNTSKSDIEKWINDYSETRLKYGASVVEVAGMKKRMLNNIEDVFHDALL